jgi:hypothetical protein
MIKSSKTTTKASAVFLATVLLAGTIALSAPSFMIGLAQAQPYYGGGMDNSYGDDRKSYGMDDKRDKSKDSVNVKKIKCNNINVNVNGIELNVTSFPFLKGLEDDDKDSSEAKYGDASYGNGGSYGSGGSYGDRHSDKDKDDFSFVCINNNNNEVGVGGGAGNVTDGVEEGCEECFDKLTGNVAEALANGLANGFTIDGLTVPPGTSIEELCVLLEGANISLTATELLALINQVLPGATDAEITQILQLVFCLEDLGLIDLELSLIPPD